MGDRNIEKNVREDFSAIDQSHSPARCRGIDSEDFHGQIPIIKFPAYRRAGKFQIINNDQIPITVWFREFRNWILEFIWRLGFGASRQ
jgi:hypothetical protein